MMTIRQIFLQESIDSLEKSELELRRTLYIIEKNITFHPILREAVTMLYDAIDQVGNTSKTLERSKKLV